MGIDGLLSLGDVDAAARRLGCELRTDVKGPAFRVEILWEGGKALPAPRVQMLGYNDEPLPPPELLGYCNGFTQPNGAAHLETIEVRKFTGFWSRKTERGSKRYAAARQLNPGLLLAVAAICCVRERAPFQCKRAELLCILDDERQHRSLVRFYRRLGCSPLREVGSDLRSVADRVLWGGEGTIMDVQVEAFLLKWTDAVRAMGMDETTSRTAVG